MEVVLNNGTVINGGNERPFFAIETDRGSDYTILAAGSGTCSKGEAGFIRGDYSHPLSEHVYDVYMEYWKDVRF